MRHFPRATLAALALSLMFMAPAGAADQSTVKVSLIDMTAMFGPGGGPGAGYGPGNSMMGQGYGRGLRNDGARLWSGHDGTRLWPRLRKGRRLWPRLRDDGARHDGRDVTPRERHVGQSRQGHFRCDCPSSDKLIRLRSYLEERIWRIWLQVKRLSGVLQASDLWMVCRLILSRSNRMVCHGRSRHRQVSDCRWPRGNAGCCSDRRRRRSGLEIARQIVVLEQDAVLQRLVPALDLALGLGMEGSAPDVPDPRCVEPFGQITGDVGGAVVAQQPWPLGDLGARSQPDALSASSSVSVTSWAFIVVHSFQAMM